MSFNWNDFETLKQQLASGDASGVIQPLQALRALEPQPAVTILLSDAYAQLNQQHSAIACLTEDIDCGFANHWTHYCLGHRYASLNRLEEAAAQFRSCHALQGWQASMGRGYTFTHDYFSGAIESWSRWFEQFITQRPIRILEIGSWQGGSTLWLLDHVISKRGGSITCVDTWQGSSEHTFIPALGLNVEELFDANIARSGHRALVQKIRGPSQQILPDLPAQSFDLIYVDGAHEASIVIQDAVNSHRLVAPGGFLLFDDLNFQFDNQAENTIHAINGFCQTFGACYEEIERGGQLLLKRRPLDALPQEPPAFLGDQFVPTQSEPGLLGASTNYLNRVSALIAARFDAIISAGPRCSTAWHLRRVFELEKAYPFDWWVTPLQSLIRLLLEGQSFEFDPDDLVVLDTTHGETVLNQRWLLQHHHDFRRDPDERIDRSDLNPESLAALNQKYQFLFNRFRQQIGEARSPLLVIGEHLSLDQWCQQLSNLPVASLELIARSRPEPSIEDVVAGLREFLNPRLTILFCDAGDPACWSPSDGLIRLRSHPIKSRVDHQLQDHHDWIQPLLAWDLRWQMLANHLLAGPS